jgi:predicted transcriptional regulator
MSVAELKSQIVEQVSAITDETAPEKIYKLVSCESDLQNQYKLTFEERQAIRRGLDDIKKGLIYTSEQAESMMKDWLRK